MTASIRFVRFDFLAAGLRTVPISVGARITLPEDHDRAITRPCGFRSNRWTKHRVPRLHQAPRIKDQ